MKINWGIKIIMSFVIFAAGIISMVVVSMSNSTDLVSENYYEQEIKYQDQIDILTNSVSLNNNIILERDDQNIVIRMKDFEALSKMKGNIHFYRSSDAGKDFDADFNPDSNGIQKIPLDEMNRGLWKVRLSLNDGYKDYFVEKNIFID